MPGVGGAGQNMLQKEHWTRSPRASHPAPPEPLGDSACFHTGSEGLGPDGLLARELRSAQTRQPSMLVIQSTSMHGAPAAARLRAAARELGPQRNPTTGWGWGTLTATEHLQGPTGDPTGSAQVREGCFRQGNSMCHCRPTDRTLAPETPRSPQGPGGEAG